MKRKKLTIDDYLEGIKNQDITTLARAISLVESHKQQDQRSARDLLRKITKNNRCIRVGISGTPGVGKSTFIESFGMMLIKKGLKVAVLAVDPSSVRSGGSILGDKTRMTLLSREPNAFIRPSPNGKTLGGIAQRSRESISLCEAFGFDVIIVETIGVGQSEVAVSNLVDVFVLLAQTGAGDELQGIKRGILEVADLIAINKADGENKENAQKTASQLQMALHILRKHPPKVFTCSALEKVGLSSIWDEAQVQFEKHSQSRRDDQKKLWFYELLKESLEWNFFSKMQNQVESSLEEVLNNNHHPLDEIDRLLKEYKND